MLLAWLSAVFQSLPPLPTSKLSPFGADSWVGGFVYILGPLWFSPTNFPVRLGVSPTTTIPKVFLSEVLRLYFPTLEPWVVQSVSLRSCSSRFICTLHSNVGPCGPPLSTLLTCPTSHLAANPLSPSCLSLFPLLPVWMNVSSLTPWLLDFHIVWWSSSSYCFLFLNWLLSFFLLCEETKHIYLRLHLGWYFLVFCMVKTSTKMLSNRDSRQCCFISN